MTGAFGRATKPLSRILRRTATLAHLATARFPVAVLLVVLFAIVANLQVAEFDLWPDWPRLLSALAGAAAASVACRVGVEGRLRQGAVLQTVLPIVAAAVAGTVLWFGEPLSLHAPALLPALVFAVPLAPFVGRGSARDFWIFTLWTGVGVTLAFASVLIFAIGLFAILEMIHLLFEVGPESRAYEHIFVTAMTLVGPLFALGRIPVLGLEAPSFSQDDRLVGAVRPLFDWVAAPLALATALILHLYAFRIAVTGEWPVGEIGWIVTFVLILFLGLRIALDPFLDRGAWTARIFGKLWAPLLLVPLALLAVAAFLRIADQGWTIERYFLVLGGVAGALAVLVQVVPWLRGDIRTLAAIPTLLLALSVAGPWSVAETVARSQMARLVDDFAGPAGIIASDALPPERRWALRSRLAELDDVGRLSDVAPLLPAQLRNRSLGRDASAETVLGGLGIGLQSPPAELPSTLTAAFVPRLDIAGFDQAALGLAVEPAASPVVSQEIVLAMDGTALLVDLNGIRDRVDIAAPIAAMRAAAGPLVADPDFDLVSEGGRQVRLRFSSLALDADGLLQGGVITLLWRRAEWPSLGGG